MGICCSVSTGSPTAPPSKIYRDVQCVFCLAPLDDRTGEIILPCGHVFHAVCFQTYKVHQKKKEKLVECPYRCF